MQPWVHLNYKFPAQNHAPQGAGKSGGAHRGDNGKHRWPATAHHLVDLVRSGLLLGALLGPLFMFLAMRYYAASSGAPSLYQLFFLGMLRARGGGNVAVVGQFGLFALCAQPRHSPF